MSLAIGTNLIMSDSTPTTGVVIVGANNVPLNIIGGSAGGGFPAVDTVIASDGVALPVDSLAQALAYNGDGTLNYVQVVYGAYAYRQTLTYTSGKVTAVSQWVKQ